MTLASTILLLLGSTLWALLLTTEPTTTNAFTPKPILHPPTFRPRSALTMTEDNNTAPPKTFREAEVLGLQFMQQGDYERALDAFTQSLQLPGSRPDVKRTKALAGPSPVGGAMGGYESQNTLALDEFELQACYYNMACAHAQLGNAQESIACLDKSFAAGFDNYNTVREDPDLEPIRKEKDFEVLMQKYEAKKGFNPFGFFSKK